MSEKKIVGVDLKIDDSIHKICEAANATSSSTRSVLYLLLLINVLAIISVMNSYESNYLSNWTKNRINQNINDLVGLYEALPDTSSGKTYYDSILPYFNIDIVTKRLENNLKNEMENVHLVKVPILGNQFDVNDLGLIGGITNIILMIILRFTLTRENNNLKLAFEAITERYYGEANDQDFQQFLESNKEVNKSDALIEINLIRRKHHYNFLSMNEIFNSPPLEVVEDKLRLIDKVMMKMFWFPFFIYAIIVINDLLTATGGWQLHRFNTILLIVSEIIFGTILFNQSRECTRTKKRIFQLYTSFKNNNYKYT